MCGKIPGLTDLQGCRNDTVWRADNHPMPLHYFLFDASDDGDGTGTWEAMASVRADQLPAVMAESRVVVSRAQQNSPGPRGPLDDGGVWDLDEQRVAEGDWTTVTLTITGPWEWGEALVAQLSDAG